MAQDTKLVKVEGKVIRVPVDASPDEIDAISKGGSTGPAAPKDIIDRAWNWLTTPQKEEADPYAVAKGVLPAGSSQQTSPGAAILDTIGQGATWASMGNPMALARATGGGTLGGYLGSRFGGKYGGPVGAGLGGLAGGWYGAKWGWRGAPKLGRVLPGVLGKLAGVAEEEPSALSGAAREASGGTAATAFPGGSSSATPGTATPRPGVAGPSPFSGQQVNVPGVTPTETALGSQAGPSAPKNATELSSTVQKIRSGTGPGTAASSPTIYTLGSLANEQGMSTAALGKGGFNLTIPPEQQRIMDLVARGKVPMGVLKPASGFEGLGKPTPFAAPSAPAPASTGINPQGTAALSSAQSTAEGAQGHITMLRNVIDNPSATREERSVAQQMLRDLGAGAESPGEAISRKMRPRP